MSRKSTWLPHSKLRDLARCFPREPTTCRRPIWSRAYGPMWKPLTSWCGRLASGRRRSSRAPSHVHPAATKDNSDRTTADRPKATTIARPMPVEVSLTSTIACERSSLLLTLSSAEPRRFAHRYSASNFFHASRIRCHVGKSNFSSLSDSTKVLNSFTNDRKRRIHSSSPSRGCDHEGTTVKMGSKNMNHNRRVIYLSSHGEATIPFHLLSNCGIYDRRKRTFQCPAVQRLLAYELA